MTTEFLEDILPETIRVGVVGGPSFLTDKGETRSGRTSRNVVRTVPLREWRIEYVRGTTDMEALYAFFLVAKGSAIAFRFRDQFDKSATTANGRLGTGAIGTGLPTYQLVKRYTSGSTTHDRDIEKPRSGTVTVYRNASPVTVGAGAGQIAIDATTGVVTFVADATVAVTGHTPGASHVFTAATNPLGLTATEKVYLSGVTGTAASTLNGVAHTIASVTGAGPYTFTISTTTTALTASGGTAAAYPQASDALTWAGDFDVPVCFTTDKFSVESMGNNLYALRDLGIEEILL